MFRPTRLVLLTALLSCIALHPAAAQTPNTGTTAAGIDVGVFFPDDAFEKTLTLGGFGEYYVTPRLSLRGMLNFASPGFQNRTEDHFRQARLTFNAVYNWEGGVWHPFVTAGAGAYFVRPHLEGRTDPDGETRGGINLGGGGEYFTSRHMSIKGELRWDIVSHPPALGDATGATLTVGVKRYF